MFNRYSSLEADYTSGRTIREIAGQLGVSSRAVWQAMKRQGIPRRAQVPRDQTGAKNHRWVGDNVSYFAAHKRVRKVRGAPQLCSRCGTTSAKRYDWANLTGKYADPSDYIRLCKSCHTIHDGLIGNLRGTPPPRRTP